MGLVNDCHPHETVYCMWKKSYVDVLFVKEKLYSCRKKHVIQRYYSQALDQYIITSVNFVRITPGMNKLGGREAQI
jgi:hypothetical protein